MNPPFPSRDTLEKQYNELKTGYHQMLEKLAQAIDAEVSSRGISVTLRYRVKEFSSWYAKLLRESRKRHKIAITDVLGIRIICPFLEEVGTVSSLLQEVFEVQEIDKKGSHYPYHQFGYESVHFLILVPGDFLNNDVIFADFQKYPVCEIQVRTILQEAWAEVEHELVYKSGFSPLDEPLKRKLAALNANLSLSDIMFQEIRDYQKAYHAAIKQRRKGFYSTVRNLPESPDLPEKPDGLDSHFEDGQSIGQKTFDALLLQGLTAHNNGRLSEAIDIYTGILNQDVSAEVRAVILVHRGMAHFSTGLSDAALGDFNEALTLNPGYTKARYYRAVHSRLKGEFRKAFADLEECINQEPLNLEFLTGRAETYMASGDIDSAIAECRAVMNIDPEFKPAKRLLARLENEPDTGNDFRD